MKKIIVSGVISALAVVSLASPALAAGNASLSLTPSSGSRTVGSSFSVSVLENGDAVNVVTANLTYDATKLTCNGVTGGAAFPGQVTGSCGGGSILISRYTNPGTTVSGSQTVASISFTASAAGSAVVSFASSSKIASGGTDIWNGVTTGGSYTNTAPVTPQVNPTNPTNPSNPTNPNTPTTPGGSTTPSTPVGTPKTTTTANGTKVTTVKNSDGSTTTTSVTKNGETTVVTKKADGTVVVKKVSQPTSKKRHWWMFGTVEGNGPLSAARYGTVLFGAAALLGGLGYLLFKRGWLKMPKTTAHAKSAVNGVKATPRVVAAKVKPLPSKVKKLAHRG